MGVPGYVYRVVCPHGTPTLQVEDAMAMWEELHRFDESINLAIAKSRPEADSLKAVPPAIQPIPSLPSLHL